MEFLSQQFKSKTIWLNVISMLMLLTEYLTNTYVLDPQVHILIVGILNLIARNITTEPIKSKVGLWK